MLFFFKLQCSGDKDWIIRREYSEFKKLYSKLNRHHEKIPKLPVFDKNYDETLKQLRNWLLNLRKITSVSMKYGAYHEFLELTRIHGLTDAKVIKQGRIKKRIGGAYNESRIAIWCKAMCTCWRHRWTAITEEGICYAVNPGDGIEGVRDILLFDPTIKIEFGLKKTGKKNGILLWTTTKKLLFSALTRKDFFEFIYSIFQAIEVSPFVCTHRFKSSSPIRHNNLAQAFINASDYYSNLCDALNNAKYEIFIRGWCICPEIHLKRPAEENQDSRLDKV
jgi:hypothetical protein